ncbi:MAG: hypothetical protein DRR16_12075 [Candidatus Parabeggiatoa sp. nov. 3]|nr:MAG: hypothetical protein DRR00_18900 [Gammaproteobacteria bacterium]RKZ66793.1 MAG: hypothetical protein DRQ99_08525 [Gammaproteobacteria bacterium]RKZ85421.1 MAG: hypothetical protein DRR16_12075 [Gammaproteobacteria bacterium]
MLKKAIFPSCLIALSSVCLAEDYYLDATTMGVGATAGENLVVKEGCLDPNESSCSDKFKWLSSVSPVKIGNLQIIGQVSGDFEIVLTADFADGPKSIYLLNTDNKGISLKLFGVKKWEFQPNGIGKGGDWHYNNISGWNGGNNFNEIKISAQNGVANVYTNGQVAGEPINFDSGVIFERVAIEGIISKDRLIDVKVRGIQGAGSCSATPAPTPSTPTTPTSSGDCMANYLNGQLHVPCVAVSDPFGTTTVYDIKLQQQSSGFTFDLDMNSVKPR